MAIPGAGIEQRIAAEQCRLVGMRPQAHVTHRMARRVHHLELDRLAHLDDIARAQAPRHVGDLILGFLVRQNCRFGFPGHRRVAARMVAMLVRVQDLGDVPPFFLGGHQTLLMVQGVDGQGLAGFAAGDEIVEIAIGVGGPDLFDYHGIIPIISSACSVYHAPSHGARLSLHC